MRRSVSSLSPLLRSGGGVGEGAASVVTLARHAMATRFEIALFGDDEARLRAAGEEALEEIFRWEQRLSRFLPHSEIGQLNARGFDDWVTLSPPVFRLLETALTLSHLTNGAFDPTLGFCDGVQLDAENFAARFLSSQIALDLGAIGKGFAVEKAAEILRDGGVSRALIHGGTSTVAAIGDGWRVALARTERVVTLNDGDSLSVSANFERAHVLDPRSGRPVSQTSLAAVVLPSATESDALSTALLVLGSDGLPLLTQFRPELSALVVTGGGAIFSQGAFV